MSHFLSFMPLYLPKHASRCASRSRQFLRVIFVLSLSWSMHVHRIHAEDVVPTSGTTEDTQTDDTSEESTDSLWVVQSEDAVGSAGLVEFDQQSGPPSFDWDRLIREPQSDKVFIEHHGYFRFRADLMHNFDLNTYDVLERRGTSQYLPPLSNREGNNQKDSDSLSSANLRFRYEPTLHATERFRVHAVMDLPDNLVLGSTPDGGPLSTRQRPDALFDGLSDTQTPLDGALRLRNVWGVWESELARVDFGRMRHHWGLGLLANGGACLDCDFGDSIDRVQVTTKLFDIYLSLSWDFVAEGLSGYGVIDQVMGQPWDWDQRDDVDQYTISLGQRAISPEELAVQRERLRSGQAVFEWGFYGIMRSQVNAGAYLDLDSAQAAPETPDPAEGGYTLYPAQLEVVIPDLFLSWSWQPSPTSKYRLAIEAVGTFGQVEHIPLASFATPELAGLVCPDLGDDCAPSERFQPRKREISAWGYALEFDAEYRNFRFGFHHGGASGDDQSGFFGGSDYYPQGALVDPRTNDPDLNGFRFDRDYIVDMILFREVLGGVHNALYFKPYFGYEVPRGIDTFWGLKAAVLYGMALNPEYTAGGESSLGLEIDLEAYLLQTNRFRASAAYGVLLPMSGLNLRTGNVVKREAETAQTFQLNFGIMF